MSMVKLIHSASFDPTVGVGLEIVDRQGELNKQASTIFGMDYDALKPDDKSVGIHVVALGDAEHFGMNRNGDLFTKKACENYHDTFVKNGHVFRHHMNKQAEKAIGKIVKSAYNAPMGRIELFIHADKEKAAPELARLEKEGEIPFSMACKVDHDRCSICGAMRKQAGDEHECDHVANHLGEQYDDGRKVGTFNDEPQFFDISFVGRPADRIAWNLKVASSEDLDSVKLAEYEGVTAPDELACETESSRRKLGYMKDLSSMQDSFVGWTTKQASVVTARDQYLYSFRKIASASLDAETISRLRELPIKTAMFALAQNGVLMDIPTFFKYATGDDYETIVKPYMEAVQKAVPSAIRSRVKQAECASLCNDATYDAAPGGRVPDILAEALKKQAYDIRDHLLETPFNADIPLNIDIRDNVCSNGNMVEKLAEAYVSYQLSAIDAVVNSRRGVQLTDAEALASVTNLKNQGE
jgi:hypothetical protein